MTFLSCHADKTSKRSTGLDPVTSGVTGPSERPPPARVSPLSPRGLASVLEAKPANVRLTGFLPDADEVGLLLASDAVISLTTLDHTMQRGAYEGVYLCRPVITSNFDLLRRHFSKGTVHVDNTVDSIADGIRRMRSERLRFQAEIEKLRAERLEDWRGVEAELREITAGK